MIGFRSKPFSVLQNLPNGNLKPGAHPLQCRELQILLASLERPVIRPVHLDLIREPFLADAARFPPLTQSLTNSFLKRPYPHGERYPKSPLLEKLRTSE